MHTGKCERCGKLSEYKYASHVKRFCSHLCSNITKWEKREKAKTVTKECEFCGNDFALLDSQLRAREKLGKKVKFCSVECSYKASIKPESKILLTCNTCGNQFTKRITHLTKNNFCSRKCSAVFPKIKRKTIPKYIDKEYLFAKGKEWREKNKDSLKRKRREILLNRTEEDRLKASEYNKAYRLKNIDKLAEKVRLSEWAKNNREKKLSIQAKYRSENKDKICVHSNLRRTAKKEGDLTHEQWAKIKEKHGNKCAHCGTVNDITLDHIVPLSKGGLHTKDNVQPLCKPCNSSKGNRMDKLIVET